MDMPGAELTGLAQAGASGIAVLLIVALVLIVKDNRKERKDMANAMATMAEANANILKDVSDRSISALNDNTRAVTALTERLPQFCRMK